MEKIPLLSAKSNYNSIAAARCSDRQMPNRYTVHHGIAFTVTFITYAFFHAARKTLSNSKVTLATIVTSRVK